MLLMDDYYSIDEYYYKLILATLCSRHGYGDAFERLVMDGWELIQDTYREVKGEPKSFIEVFKYYLATELRVDKAEEIINASYEKLFNMSVFDILTEILGTYHMDKKILTILKKELTGNSKNRSAQTITDANWQQMKDAVQLFLRKNIKLETKFIGEGSSFFGMIGKTLQFFVKNHRADLFSLINKTGMYLVDENEFSLSMLNIETLSNGEVYDINFPEVMRSIHKLNSILYTHSASNVDKFYFYDLISFYQLPELEKRFNRLSEIFFLAFKSKGSHFMMINENKDLKNTGVKEKFQKYRDLLRILDPVVRKGLNPGDVESYVEKIYRHVLNTQSSSSANLFTISPATKKIGNFGTETAFSKMDGHEVIKDVLDGVMALHHLFMYIAAKKINIFDIRPEAFMHEYNLYRYSTLEEVIDLFEPTEALRIRPEDAVQAEIYEENALPLNDDVVSAVGVDKIRNPSLLFASVFGSLGDLNTSGKGRKERGKKDNPIYKKFVRTLELVIETLNFFKNLQARITFGNTEFSIPYVRYIQNISKMKDLVTALEINIFTNRGIAADLACAKDSVTGYWEYPTQSFAHYCYNNAQIEALVKSLHTQNKDNNDTILEVYRSSSFFMSMMEIFTQLEVSLHEIYKKFDITTGVPMGYFDAYSFVSKNLMVCQMRSMDEVKAITKILELMHTELFITNRINPEKIPEQLIRIYRMFLKKFETPLDELESMMDAYYTDFANRLGGGYSLVGDESFFEEARGIILKERCTVNTGEFANFARRCKKTMKGFLKKDGKLTSIVEDGVTMFLSETGMWIGKSNTGQFVKRLVSESDFSGGL